jgi:hypothetical protein
MLVGSGIEPLTSGLRVNRLDPLGTNNLSNQQKTYSKNLVNS